MRKLLRIIRVGVLVLGLLLGFVVVHEAGQARPA